MVMCCVIVAIMGNQGVTWNVLWRLKGHGEIRQHGSKAKRSRIQVWGRPTL